MPGKKITELSAHVTIIDADSLPIVDSVAAETKKILWSTAKSTLETYFDTAYLKLDQTVPQTTVGTFEFPSIKGADLISASNYGLVQSGATGNLFITSALKIDSTTGGIVTILDANSGFMQRSSAADYSQIGIGTVSGIGGYTYLKSDKSGTGVDLPIQLIVASDCELKIDTDAITIPSFTSAGFVKTSAAGLLSVDTNTYLTSLTGAVLVSQTVGQTIGDTTDRLVKLWATDITCTNAITGSVTGNAGTATKLAAGQNINGVSFDGSAGITVPVNSTDDTTTNSTMYPLWTTAAGNNAAKISTTKMIFNPSTGLLTVTGFSGPLTGNVTGDVSGNAGTVTGFSPTSGKILTVQKTITLTSAGDSAVITLPNATVSFAAPGASGNIMTSDGTDWTSVTPTEESTVWMAVPGTPTRVSDTQLTITDAGNANSYDSLLSKGTIIKWLDGTIKQAMITSATYGADTVTINIIGDVLAAGFTVMKYFTTHKVNTVTFIITGSLGVGTDLSSTWYAPYDAKIFGADARVKTAGTTNSTDFDINDDGTTMFTTKPSIASGDTYDLNSTADSGTVVAEGSLVTVDIDAVSTTAPIEAYIILYFTASKNIFLT